MAINNLKNLKGCPKICNGSFYCNENDLTSLEGCPEEIRGTFDMSDCSIESFEYCPKLVTGYFLANFNKITKLDGLPSKLTKLELKYNPLENLNNCPDIELLINLYGCRLKDISGLKTTSGKCKVNLYSNEIEKIGDLTNLKLDMLNLSNNLLTDLKGCPQNVKELRVTRNNLTSLEGCPQSIDRIDVSENKLTSFLGGPKIIKQKGDFTYNKIIDTTDCPTDDNKAFIYLHYNPINKIHMFSTVEELNLINTFKVINGKDINLKRLKYFYSILNIGFDTSLIKKIKQYYNIIE